MDKSQLSKIRTHTHNEFLDYRGIDRLMYSGTFEIACNDASDSEIEKLESILQRLDSSSKLNGLKEWMCEQIKTSVELWPIRQLRERAGVLHIKQYTRMSKNELLMTIIEKEKQCANDARSCTEQE